MAKIIEKTVGTKRNYAKWLNSIEWQYFMTGTTAYTLTLKSARRLAERYHSLLSGTHKLMMFWVAEKFELKDGMHIHALLMFEKELTNMEYKGVCNLWQVACGNSMGFNPAKNKWDIWHRIDLQKYDTKRDGGGYCAKYINKAKHDFDIIC